MATPQELKILARETESEGFFSDAYKTIQQGLASMVSGDPEIRRQIGPYADNSAENLKSLAELSEIPAEETVGTAFGTGFTETIPFAIGLGVLTQAIPPLRPLSGAGRIRTALQNSLSTYGQIFRQRPGTVVTGEAFAGGFGGASGYGLEKAFPDLPGARFIGEMAGGFGAELVPNAIKMMPTISIVRGAVDKLSPSTAQRRASELLSIGDRQGALAAIQEAQDFSPGAQFTSGTLSGDPIYSRMEQTIIKASNNGEVTENLSNMIQQTSDAIYNDISFGGLNPQELQSMFENQVRHYSALLDARMQIAATRAQRDISKIQPDGVREAIEPVVRGHITDAVREAREFESALYSAVDQSEIVNINLSKIAFQQLSESLPIAKKGNMPNAAKYLDPNSSSYLGKKTVDGKTQVTNQNTLFELRGVQSALRAEARNARAGDNPNFDLARIADELADSITEDIANIYAEQGQENPLATAIAFSRELNERFGTGDVARILGRSRSGGDRIDPSMTLSSTLGAGPRINRVAYDDILQSVSGNPDVQLAMEDFIKFHFFRNQDFNPGAAQEFLVTNSDLMNRMPTLRREIQDAIRSNDSSRLSERRALSGTEFLNPKVNKAIIYINSSPTQAFNQVLSSTNPAREMRSFIRMAERDNTGDAIQGLKSSFADYIFNRSISQQTLPNGNKVPILDGMKFYDLLNEPKVTQTMMTLFSREERARFERAARTARMLSSQMQKRETIELVQEQDMNYLQKALLRVSGASIGRRLGTGTLQAPEMVANIFERLGRGGVLDAETKILEDAIFNQDLFKALLEKPSNGTLSPESQRAFRAWAAQTLATYGDEEQEEQ